MTPAEVFSDIYARNLWGDGSGGGSDPETTRPFCRLVQDLLVLYDVRTVLDIGCGDGRVFSEIHWGKTKYTGIDCVGIALIRHPAFDVRIADALVDPLPGAELVILKEVTQHLPNADIARLMERLRGYPLVLHCSGFGGEVNADIRMGETRPVDLAAPPFHLPAKRLLTYSGGYTVQLLERGK